MLKNIIIVKKFTFSIFISSIRDYKSILITLGLPLFMLFTFWITTRDGSVESEELLHAMIPAICSLAVMMGGQTQATRLVKWREEGALRRLRLTPIPVNLTVLGISISQVLIGVVQGVLITLISLPLIGKEITFQFFVLVLIIMFIIAVTFISLGSLLASVIKKSYMTGYIFFGVFMPLFFIGSFPKEALPEFISNNIHYLPTTMGIHLVHDLFEFGNFSMNVLFSVSGLIIYSLIFSFLSNFLYLRNNNDTN
ncbi:MAG: ABC transporter permease [Spirochaetales bacterium]|nr:ABC transporter permease [Spirochaetales bacterium]